MTDMNTMSNNQKALAYLTGNALVALVKKHTKAARVIALAAMGVFCLYASYAEAVQ